MKAKLHSALSSYFKFDEFRPGQLESLVPFLHGKDVFTHLATGSDESLCTFLAPISSSDSAMAVIVSPLNGLMDEQVSYRIDGGWEKFVRLLGWSADTHWSQCCTCDSKHASR